MINKETIEAILTTAFEIEGLATLILQREEATPAKLAELLKEKNANLNYLIQSIEDPAIPVVKQCEEQISEEPASLTLNDKFHLINSLFEGNEADYTECLNCLSEMKSREDAEDYIFNDLCIDTANKDVQMLLTHLFPQ